MQIDSTVTEPSDKSLATDPLSILDPVERQVRRAQAAATRNRFLFACFLLLTLFGLLMTIYPSPITRLFMPYFGYYDSRQSVEERDAKWLATNSDYMRLVGALVLIVSTTGFAFLYMEGFFTGTSETQGAATKAGPSTDSNLHAVVQSLKLLARSIEEGKLESALSERERREIIAKIAETVETQLNSSLLKAIDGKYGRQIRNERIADVVIDTSKETIQRLKTSAMELQRKANVNLGYGLGSAILGMAILAAFVFTVRIPEGISNIGEAFYYSSRIAIVLLVETLALFFLNLYKSTLHDIKFTNNEITNIEAKTSAVVASLRLGEVDSMRAVLSDLSKTERNFALKKGEVPIFNATQDQGASYALLDKLLEKLPVKAGPKE